MGGRSGWELDRLAAGYRAFLDAFRPVWLALQREVPLEPVRGFALRTLLMHGYRRATLHDPLLPDELMPHDWPGAAARALCRNLYRNVEAAAEKVLGNESDALRLARSELDQLIEETKSETERLAGGGEGKEAEKPGKPGEKGKGKEGQVAEPKGSGQGKETGKEKSEGTEPGA